jgi:hypothetical protein
MPTPRLIHPIPVEVRQLQRSSTKVDEDFREEIEHVSRGTTVTIPGQVEWKTDNRLRANKTGVEQASDGYVLFRTADIRTAGLTQIDQGDQIVAYGIGANRVAINVFVISTQYLGHYPNGGGPQLVKCFFKDRTPGKLPGAGFS